ncbi:MAG: hypothetical protein AW07_04493 [Candidatus Accumulibacter sp. SK-11]|nr:MAG: hypothetical protein AW07_04493 [Candidatus Accumulibacter sp. SK-11]
MTVESDGHGSQHAMTSPRQTLQNATCLIGISRLADQLASQFQRRVGSQNRLRQQASPADKLAAVRHLAARQPFDVVPRVFAGQRRLVDRRVFARRTAEADGVEGDADLSQQLAPARAARSEMDALLQQAGSHFSPRDGRGGYEPRCKRDRAARRAAGAPARAARSGSRGE